ncbi:MAG: carboxy-S-adenosyl-L-methionine synthase CmoA [Gammaproteobacteria bacterium]|nr:carboxy-S-adenosyl-L-methionine synthase CmoA [Gammaproteobacteria bacterium]
MNKEASGSSDQLYAEKLATVRDFTFNEAVTKVFNDMVRRSVPGYEAVVELIGVIAAAHSRSLKRPIHCVDLGCSRGAVTQSLLNQLPNPSTRIVAIDNSDAMIQAARKEITDKRVTFVTEDILQSDFKNADVVVMNLVLQFIDQYDRSKMLKKIRRGLRDDGLLILTEKIHADTEFVEYHHSFKRSRGYSELEITQKRDALEKVMVIDSLETHQTRLNNAGFSQVTVWFQLLNWISLIARP